LSGLSNVFLFPVGGYSFRDALVDLAPYSPRLSFNFIDPTNSLFQGNTLTPVASVTNPVGVVIDQTQGGLGSLGADVVTNGGFGSSSNWTTASGVGWAISGGTANATGANAPVLLQTCLTAGKFYEITLDVVTTNSSGALTVYSGVDNTIPASNANLSVSLGRQRGVFYATGTSLAIRKSVGYVGSIDNVSVREIPGNHATASSDAKRPLWNEFTVNGRTVRGAVFDGSDDCLQVSGFDLSNTDKACVIAGVRAIGTATSVIVETSANYTSTLGGFVLTAPDSNADYGFGLKGSGSAITYVATGFAAPTTNHISSVMDIAGATKATELFPRVNNILLQTGGAGTNAGSGNFSNQTLNIGGRNNSATFPFNGAYSYLFICGVIPPDEILTKIYRGLAPQIGVAV
jgi:hypothetical protein